MFLRFGYAVGHVGLLGAYGIILLGHLVTFPTALALAEIATNRKVEGGGEYFIISRSFGTTVGSVIGISLYVSQAISVAFYLIAFAEAFSPFSGWIAATLGFYDPRLISIPATLVLLVLVFFRGANLGVKMLYVVVLTMVASLVLFFLGKPAPDFDPSTFSLTATTSRPDAFFVVFAICFPAFTGMTAGVGLSGDLTNPRKSIPLGTLLATTIGMVVYFAIVTKLALSAPVESLATNQLVMADIALWGPIILIGLGAATLSSAIGSVLVAPRTLQALGSDGSLPLQRGNAWLGAGSGDVNEPRNATLVTGAIAVTTVFLGNVDFVARLVSMFFMVTYGSLCAISFLENFAARPDYRPSFRSRWWVSLFGALICGLLMFLMDPVFAILAILVMIGLYRLVVYRSTSQQGDLAAMFEGVMTQATRYLNLRLQPRRRRIETTTWRPSILMVNDRAFDRRAPLELMRWICDRYGFGTYLHFISGKLTPETFLEGERVKERLIEQARNGSVYMDAVVSPSLVSAFAQGLQVPGVAGLNNNTVLFEFSCHDDDSIAREIIPLTQLAAAAQMTQLVIRHGDFFFGARKSIHIWLTWNDDANAGVMILLSYILLGHPDWSDAEIRVFVALPTKQVAERRKAVERLVVEGRLPISIMNLHFLSVDDNEIYQSEVERLSADADLTLFGFTMESLAEREERVFLSHPGPRDVLFVFTPVEITIS